MWAQIPEFPDYEVSTEGQVRKFGQRGVKTLTLRTDGYIVTGLMYQAVQYMRLVHCLVLPTFLPNPAPWHYNCCDHINGDRTDNRLVNLRWSNKPLNGWNRVNAKGWTPSGNRYQARIRVLGHLKGLGSYDTSEEAHARYLEERGRLQELYDPTNSGSYMESGYRQINSLLRGGCNIA